VGWIASEQVPVFVQVKEEAVFLVKVFLERLVVLGKLILHDWIRQGSWQAMGKTLCKLWIDAIVL
jgi:hypothetical protein